MHCEAGEPNFDQKALRLINLAKQYAYAAVVLDEKIINQWADDNLERPQVEHDAHSYLWVPSLHLTAHSLECMAKSCFYLSGLIPNIAGREGHNLNKLLSARVTQLLVQDIKRNSVTAAYDLNARLRLDGIGLSDPEQWIVEAIRFVGDLHYEGGSLLRYGSDDPMREAPLSPLLSRTMYLTSQAMGLDRSSFGIAN